MFLINTLALMFSIAGTVNGIECKRISNCGCELEDGSGKVDLTPMTRLKSAPMYALNKQLVTILNIYLD